MDLPPVPPRGRCVCGAWLWYLRARHVGEAGRFECMRCRREYRPQHEAWSPEQVGRDAK